MSIFKRLTGPSNTVKQKTALVITPTIGTNYLSQAIISVMSQTYSSVEHLIVVDGDIYLEKTKQIILDCQAKNFRLLVLPYNTGGSNYNGHRIYAACSYLVEADYIFFLDEDNWYDENHISSLVNLIEQKSLDWAYSMRKICDNNRKFVVNDDCESIGAWPPYSKKQFLVDTSCYAVKKDVLTKVGHYWFDKYTTADRTFFQAISRFSKNFDTTFLYTLNYLVPQNKIPNVGYFLSGNEFMLKKYRNKLPWKNK